MQIGSIFSFIVWLGFYTCMLFGSQSEEFPVLYQGRFRPADAYARLWLQNFYHSQTIKNKDLASFNTHTPAALDFLLKLHVIGHKPWIEAPLFWIASAETKQLAQLDLKRDRFSYEELQNVFYHHPFSSQKIIEHLATYEFLKAYLSSSNYSHKEKFELTSLSSGLWLQLKDIDLIVVANSPYSPWPFLKPGYTVARNVRSQAYSLMARYKKSAELLFSLLLAMRQFENLQGNALPLEKKYAEYWHQLKNRDLSVKEISIQLEKDYPLIRRLKEAGSLFQALPSIYQGEWFSLHALKVSIFSPSQNALVPVENFTLFSNDQFEKIRAAYLAWEKAVLEGNSQQVSQLNNLSHILNESYRSLAGSTYRKSNGKALYYPSLSQLQAESLYYHYAWIKYLILFYLLSILILSFATHLAQPKMMILAYGMLGMAFILHTSLLAWRSYILNRPPVSNMFETVIFVPWVTMLGALLLNFIKRHTLILISAALAAVILLIILEITDLNHSLDNVQAVLDSQFWLLIHVLMVVGSYGLFILGAILGHFYLGYGLYYDNETPFMRLLSQSILQSLYLGLALLIPGTILGGVWAAESWGRFWDWDPKESWAFISICFYLIWVHAYRYHKVASFGLAIGAVCGLLVISFTWYGVNYILGTGLHSYGFGSGGEIFYYAFLGIELIFLGFCLVVKSRYFKKLQSKNI